MSTLQKTDQNVPAKYLTDFPDTLSAWMEAYFRVEVTTAPRSQREQRRDFQLFLDFVFAEEGSDERVRWTPRLSRAFVDHLRQTVKAADGRRRWSDRTINRMISHLKTFSRWVHKLNPFPLDDPMAKISLLKVGLLDVDRALTESERRKLLDTADFLPVIGGRSKDKRRHKGIVAQDRPQRKGYRPWRNRAIIYTLVETGIRRAEVCSIDLEGVDANRRTVAIIQKGGEQRRCPISKEGLAAIQDYIAHERTQDATAWSSPALFLPAETVRRGHGRLDASMINRIMTQVCEQAGVQNRTPHSARHGMGKHIINKSGNPRAVQRQLGHANPSTSMQYMDVTNDELNTLLDER